MDLPDDADKAFLAKRQLLLFGGINEEIQERTCASIFYLNALSDAGITLLIDSHGGIVDIAHFLSDTIHNSKARISGLVVGVAHSAAFQVLQACHERLAYPHATLLFHPTRLSEQFNVAQSDLISKIAVARRGDEEFLFFLAKRSGQSVQNLRSWSKAERYFSAKEAKSFGLLDKITRA